MNATPTKKERIYVHLNKSTRPWTCEIRSELDDSILASGLAADGYQDHTSSADIIVRAVNSYDAMKKALEMQIQWRMRDGSPCACPAGRNEDEPRGKMPTLHSTACEDLRAALALAKGQ